MQRIYRYIRGTVTIKVIGSSLQRFMNLCSVRGIELNKIQIYAGYATMELYLSSFYDIKSIVHKTKMKVVLLERKGLPFTMKKIKKRKAFFLGFMGSFLLLFWLSLYIWDIKLDGATKLTKPLLISFLQDEGVGYGSRKSNIEITKLEKKLLKEYPFIVWDNISVEGTRLIIKVKEADLKEVKQLEKNPSDIYATVNGTVHSMITRSGMPLVKVGEIVKQKQKLVSGQIPIMNDDETVREYMKVHSDADISIDTEFLYDECIPYSYEKKEYDGLEKCIWYVKLYQHSFSLGYVKQIDHMDVSLDLKQAKLLDDFYLPIYYGKISYKEYRVVKETYSKKEIRKKLQDGFVDFCNSLSQKGIQILNKNVKIKDNGQNVIINAKVKVRVQDGEQIAIP